MGRKKSKAAKIVDVITGADETEATPEAEPKKIGGEWWATMTLREFKDTIAKFNDRAELGVLLAAVRESVRRVTLRPYVEDMTDQEQKMAGRMAPIYRGCVEAVLSRIHAIPVVNKSLDS